MLGATPVGAKVSGTGASINLTVIESNLVAGNNTISILADNGACAAATMINTCAMNYDNTAVPVVSSTSNQLCGLTPVTASVPAGASTYQWYMNGTSMIIGANANTYSVVAPGNYSVDITTASGCALSSAPKAITNMAAPTIQVSGGSGNDTLLTVVAPGATSYQWYAGQKAIVNETSANYRLYFISDYSVSANINGCRMVSAPYTANNGSMSLLVRMNFLSTDSTIYITPPGLSTDSKADIFPNPSTGRFTVDYKCHSSKSVSMKIYNTAGGLMAEKEFDRHSGYISSDFDELRLIPGLYLLYIIENQKTVVKSISIY
jgi:hypothetical protein